MFSNTSNTSALRARTNLDPHFILAGDNYLILMQSAKDILEIQWVIIRQILDQVTQYNTTSVYFVVFLLARRWKPKTSTVVSNKPTDFRTNPIIWYMWVITSIGLYKSFSNRRFPWTTLSAFTAHQIHEQYIPHRVLYGCSKQSLLFVQVSHEYVSDCVKQYLEIQLYLCGWLVNFTESRQKFEN